jgi:hypothetical protein
LLSGKRKAAGDALAALMEQQQGALIMTDVYELYQGQYLRAGNLGGKEHAVQIMQAPAEMVGQGEKAQQKIVLHLAKPNGKPLKQKLPLNKTNAMLLASVFGPRTENWIGRTVLLRPERTLMQGAYVDCIRTYVPPESLGKSPQPVVAAAAVPVAAAPAAESLEADDDGLESDELI